MSFSINTHRPVEADAITVALPVIPWSVEYDWQGNGSANETRLASLISGRNYPSKATFQSNLLSNVYQNTDLAGSPQKLPNRTGTKVYLNNTEVWSKLSSDDATYEALMPAVCSIMLKVPNDPTVTATIVGDFLLRTAAMFFAEGTDKYAWIQRLLVGSTNPTLTINT